MPEAIQVEALGALKAAITIEVRAKRIDAQLIQWLRDYQSFISPELGPTNSANRKVSFSAEGAIILEVESKYFAKQIRKFLKENHCSVELQDKTIWLTAVPGVQLNQIIKAVFAGAGSPLPMSDSPRAWLANLKQNLDKSSPENAKKAMVNALQSLCQQSASVKIHFSKSGVGVFLIDCKQEDVANAIFAKLTLLGCTAQVKTDGRYANKGVVVTAIPGIDLKQIFKTVRAESPASTPTSAYVDQMSDASPRTSWSSSIDSKEVGSFFALSAKLPISPIPQTTPTRQNTMAHQVEAHNASNQETIAKGMLGGARDRNEVLRTIKKYIVGKGLDQAVAKEFNILGFKVNGKSKSDGISEILKIIDSSDPLDDQFERVKKLLISKDSEQGDRWQDKHSAPASRGRGFKGFFKPTRARPIAEFYSAAATAIECWRENNAPQQVHAIVPRRS